MQNFVKTLLSLLILSLNYFMLVKTELSTKFELVANKELSSIGTKDSYFKLYSTSLIRCLVACNENNDCVLAMFKSNECNLFKLIRIQYFVCSNYNCLYKKPNNKYDNLANGLINFWPIVNDTKDIISGANLYNGYKAKLTYDRFNNSDSALDLALGYYQIPAGFYFNYNFTMTAWVYVRSLGVYSRIFDFGNGLYSKNVLLCYMQSNIPRLALGNANTGSTGISVSYSPFNLKQWYYFAATYDGKYGKLYVNGSLVSSAVGGKPDNVLRATNYVGRSNNWQAGDTNADGLFDDLRIYNRALSAQEILDLMAL